jgi:hypothetical protein
MRERERERERERGEEREKEGGSLTGMRKESIMNVKNFR